MKRLNVSHGELELDDNLSGQSCLINRLAQRYNKRPVSEYQKHETNLIEIDIFDVAIFKTSPLRDI